MNFAANLWQSERRYNNKPQEAKLRQPLYLIVPVQW